MIARGHVIKGSSALILGITFKENCPDVRNTKVVDIYNELLQFGIDVDIYDPWADLTEVKKEYGIDILSQLHYKKYESVIIAVAHDEFLTLNYNLFKENNAVIFDTKSFLDRSLVDSRL